MTEITLNPVFVRTKNVRNFEVLMDGLALAEGEGRLGLVFGQAGRGKTRTSQWYAANNGCVYLRVASVWRTSELDFLQALLREMEVKQPPHRKGPCYIEAIDRLVKDPHPVFIDELEKLPQHFLDLVRDLSDMSAAAFVLIGEEELVPYMRRNRRVWSRTFQQIEFEPISASDIIFYARDAAGLNISPQVAAILHKASSGDFRLVRRDMLALVQIANGHDTREITEKMANVAVKMAFNGK